MLADLPISGPISRKWDRPSIPAEFELSDLICSGYLGTSRVGFGPGLTSAGQEAGLSAGT